MNVGAKIKSLDVVMKGIGFNKPDRENNIGKKGAPPGKLAKPVVHTSVSILCDFIFFCYLQQKLAVIKQTK